MGEDKSKFYRRLKLFGIGVVLGCVLVYFLLIRGKDFGFWTPENRVLELLQKSELSFSQVADCQMQCMNVSENEVKEIFKSGSVNFDESNVRTGNCPIYVVFKNTEKDKLKITVSACDSIANVLQIEKPGFQDKCACE